MPLSAFLIKNFVRLSAADTVSLARQVNFRLTDHPVIKEPFPGYVPSLQKIVAGADGLEAAQFAALNRDLGKIAIKNQCCTALQTDLGTLAQHVELAAQGDPAVLQTVGFPMKHKRGRTAARIAPDQPELAIAHGKLSGTLVGTVTRSCKGGSTEVEITDGDPTVEGNWRRAGAGTYVLSKFELTGLQPGTKYSLRARCVSSGGTGPWSTNVTIICL
jgi:hypothetical protein